MTSERVKCNLCDSLILLSTAQLNSGLCAQCIKIPPSQRKITEAVNRELSPFDRAVEMYSSLIDTLTDESTMRNFGAISDPEITAVRFYAPDSIRNLTIYDESSEIGSEVVDEIENYLLADTSDRSLLVPIALKLKSISPLFNSVGKTVFFTSIGMGTEETAWLVRYLNDRPTFENFLNETGLTEKQVDAYNESYYLELNQTQ